MAKKTFAVLQANSLRSIVDQVNRINNSDDPKSYILKEDIVTIFKEDEAFFLIYFK